MTVALLPTPRRTLRRQPGSPSKAMSEADFETWAMRQKHLRVEWVNGEVQLMSPANWDHTDYQTLFAAVLRPYVESKGLGAIAGPEFMVRLLPDQPRRRVPDLLFITKARLHLIQKNFLEGPPDLAIEIVSPDNPSRDYREKFLEYEAAGVREYWIVDPMLKKLELYTRSRSGKFELIPQREGRFDSKVVRGFFLDPKWLFAAKRPTVLPILKKLGVI